MTERLQKITWKRTWLKRRRKGTTTGVSSSKVAVDDTVPSSNEWTEEDEMNAFLRSQGVLLTEEEVAADEARIKLEKENDEGDIENQENKYSEENIPESEMEDVPPPETSEEEIERLEAIAAFVVFQYSESMAR